VADNREIDFQFPRPQRSGQRVIKLAGIHHAYGENVVYQDMNFEAARGQRIVLVGPNGAGKSTLLKILAGVLIAERGELTLGHNVKSGYYSQYRVDMLRAERTVLEEALDTPQRVTEQFVRTLLGCFLFRGDDVFKRVGVLSGGEKSRLALVKILLDPPNLLLMDEPTTHLDMSSIDALAYALHQFPGTLIFISHDVYFIRALANHVVHVNAGRLTHYPGGYQYYLDKTKAQSERAGLTAGGSATRAPELQNSRGKKSTTAPEPSGAPTRKEQKRLDAEGRQTRSRQRKAQLEIVQTLEKEIHTLEGRQKEIVAELERPETYEKPGAAVAINRELLGIQEQLGELTPRWEAEATRLADMEST
jgi:ATP-binding cassette subfamily F protein 3